MRNSGNCIYDYDNHNNHVLDNNLGKISIRYMEHGIVSSKCFSSGKQLGWHASIFQHWEFGKQLYCRR